MKQYISTVTKYQRVLVVGPPQVIITLKTRMSMITFLVWLTFWNGQVGKSFLVKKLAEFIVLRSGEVTNLSFNHFEAFYFQSIVITTIWPFPIRRLLIIPMKNKQELTSDSVSVFSCTKATVQQCQDYIAKYEEDNHDGGDFRNLFVIFHLEKSIYNDDNALMMMISIFRVARTSPDSSNR